MGPQANPFAAAPRAFISYARSDGEQIAAALRARLEQEHPEITLWLDRAQMVGGVGWWKQITDALNQVQILIMVLTPGAVQSEVAAKEWRYARQQGVRICPVRSGTPDVDFEAMPRWMRKAHCYDLAREWPTFIGYLHSEGQPTRVPFMAPDLPERFVPRATEFNALRAQLLDASGENSLAVTAALQGAGGFGKTTLACMVCHDPGIISAFDDGILWVTLGESPNLQGELTKLYAALTGERPPFVDIDDASIQVATRLDEKNCLVVIDDVWDPNHLKPFMRGGSQCARLITTRQLSVIGELGITRTLVDRMSADESLLLLTQRIQSSPAHDAALRKLADGLGHWPLLLKLAGSQLRERIDRGDSLEGALTYVHRALDKRGVVAFDRTGRGERSDAVSNTVAASLELFSDEDQLRCARLAVFRPGTAIPLSAVGSLWGVDAFDAEDLLLRLDDAALLEFDLKTASVRLHSVLQSYFANQLGSAQSLHALLTERWLEDPLRLPDQYAWNWIGWHVVQAGRADRLEALLLDFAWLQARLRAVSIQVALQDFELTTDSPDLRVVRDALRLAIDGLNFDGGQLRVQLCGRIARGLSPRLDRLLEDAGRSDPRPRLELADVSLTHPGGALTGILKSHTAAIEALALAPSGTAAVSASQDWTLRLWDLNANSVVRILEAHRGTVHAVAFTPDGQKVLSGSEDRTLRLWDAVSGAELRVFRGHTLAVRGVAVAANGTLAYSAGEDGVIREWDLATGATRVLHRARSHQLGPLALTTDGRQLIFGAGDWTIGIMDLSGVIAIRTLEGHSGNVRTLALARNDTTLLSGGDDGVVRVWAIDTGACRFELRGHEASVDAVAIAMDLKRAVSGSSDRTLRVWDLATGTALRVLTGHSGFVRGVGIHGDRIVSASSDRTVRHWNIESSAAQSAAGAHEDAVSRLAVSSDGNRALSGAGGRDLQVWNATEEDQGGRRVVKPRVTGLLTGHTDRIQVVQLNADGTLAVTGSRDRTLRVWDIAAATSLHVLKGHFMEVLDVQLSADGTCAVSLSRDRTLRAWDIRAGRAVRALVAADNDRARKSLGAGNALLAELDTVPTVDVMTRSMPREPKLALSPDGTRVVLGSQGNACVWDLHTGETSNQELGDFDIVTIEFGREPDRVVMGSLFGPLLLWHFGRDPVPLEGHAGKVLDVVVTPDARTAISAASDDTIRLWDLGDGRQTRCLEGSVGRPDAVAIAPSGRFACSIYGHTLVAHDLAACKRLGSISFDHQITAVSLTPSGTRLVIGDLSGRLHFLSLQIEDGVFKEAVRRSVGGE